MRTAYSKYCIHVHKLAVSLRGESEQHSHAMNKICTSGKILNPLHLCSDLYARTEQTVPDVLNKFGRKGRFNHAHMESAVIARPLRNSCYLLARFSVYVSTLFGLKKTDNLYEFKYLYQNQTFSKFSQQNCFILYFFTIFDRLL